MTPAPKLSKPCIECLHVFLRGAVQGVGFRPFVYRLARELHLNGWVSNGCDGVRIQVEGESSQLRSFITRLESEKPPRSYIQSLESAYIDPAGCHGFEIRQSSVDGAKTAVVLPDIATCPECVREIFDPANRRYRYPFTNCTNCGPRFSIIENLPYDRPNTTMRRFTMCSDCRSEYEDPLDRRFHAQPNACAECGPKLQLWNDKGRKVASENAALICAADGIRAGRVVAVKGIGGFHLFVNARNRHAVDTLRKRKHRQDKPLALMFPSLADVEEICEISDQERRAILSPERPIVILQAKSTPNLAPNVAPGNPYLGCMLPYSPLHHLLMEELGFAVVATSGNLSDEPICIDEQEAVIRLNGIADMFLVHDRPIIRHVDDSIVRIMAGRPSVIRRSRGYAPLPIQMGEPSESVVAMGAHLKNTVAAVAEDQVFISQHIGDLETPQAFNAFRDVINSFQTLYDISPSLVVCDEHPDYISTRFARTSTGRQLAVQHHYAHVLSCMAENKLDGPALGVAWDGTGLGSDGTIWGGEFLRIGPEGFTRSAHLRNFPLPGGEKAALEPRRSAIGALYQVFGDGVFYLSDIEPVKALDPGELQVIQKVLLKGLNAPITSSAGRLFDAVASVTGTRQIAGFEGQAAMELEFAIGALETDEFYSAELSLTQDGSLIVDWGKALTEIIADMQTGVSRSVISVRFHNMLAESIIRVAHQIRDEAVVLSGGCFQNRYLLERTVQRLRSEGFRPYWHQRVPTNDGGIALGQAVAGTRYLAALRKNAADRRTAVCV